MSNVALIVNNVLTDSGVTLASKADLVNGLVPANQLPSYVDDVLEFANLAAFPATGESAKIYLALDTNETYRWSGSAYIRIANGAVQSVNSLTGNITLTTTNIGEGTNQYFTNARARSAISVAGSLSYNASTGVLSYTQPTNVSAFTNDSAYITTAGARTAISVSGSLSYNSTTGVISYTQPTNISSFTNDSAYVTAAGARSALSFAAGSGAYNSSTGVITIPTNTNQLTNGAGYITGNQTITLSGDASGSGTTAITVTLSNSGVTAGTYTKVTVDAKGRVTVGASLASGDLPTYTGTLTSSQVTTALGYTPYNSTNPNGYTSNTGTVTSVSGTGTVSGLTLSGTVTTSGSLTLGGTLTLTSGQVTTALGYTPYNSSNPAGYISSYTETDTLATVTGRGATTSTALTLSGNVSIGGQFSRSNINFENQNNFHRIAFWDLRFWDWDAGNDIFTLGQGDGNVRVTNSLLIGGNTAWHQGNLTNLNQLSNGPGYITGYTETDTLATVVSRGSTTSGSISIGGNLTVSSNNTTGGGIILADDGDIVDLNDAFCSMRFTSGVRIFSANRGGSAVITLGSNGTITASAATIGGSSVVTNNGGTWGINVTGSAGSTGTLFLTSLGNGSVNVNNGNSAVYRNENGSGAALPYSPVLHLGGGDTMWQIQGSYGTSGNGTLYFRQGYAGSWGNWLTMISSANIGSQSVNYASSAGNADTLDGFDQSYFFSKVNMDAARNIVSGTNLDTDLENGGAYSSYGAGGTSWNAPFAYGGVIAYAFTSGIRAQFGFDIRHTASDYGDLWYRTKNNVGYSTWRKIWHSGNQGSGSGMNADTVDGLHASAFTRDYGQQVNVGNLNNLDGRFLVNLDGYGPINTAGGPDGSFNAGLIGIGNSSRGHQIYLPYDQNQMYFRRGAGGWSGWFRVLNTTADPIPANMDQYVRTSDNVAFNVLNINAASGGSSGQNTVVGIQVRGFSNYPSLELGIEDAYAGVIRTYGNDLRYYSGHWRTVGAVSSEDHSHFWYTSRNGSADWSVIKMALNHRGHLTIQNGDYAGLTINRDLGTNDYTNSGQHNMHLRLRKLSADGGCAPRTLELGVLDNGTGIIQANHCGVGYQTLALNPVAGTVTINGVEAVRNTGTWSISITGNSATTSQRLFDKLEISRNGAYVGYVDADLIVGHGGNDRRGFGATGGSNIMLRSSAKCTITALDEQQNLGQIGYENLVWTIGEDIGWGLQRVAAGGELWCGITANSRDGGVGLVLNDGALHMRASGDRFHKIWYFDGIAFGTNSSHGRFRFYAESNTQRSAGSGGATLVFEINSVNGNAWASGDITAFSDARVKTNVAIIENALEKIQAIRGVTFNRTDVQEQHKDKRHAGVIAQEVLDVLPEVVTTDKEGMHSVAYGNLAALLIEAIKEQQTHIDTQKSEIEELKELVKQLINK